MALNNLEASRESYRQAKQDGGDMRTSLGTRPPMFVDGTARVNMEWYRSASDEERREFATVHRPAKMAQRQEGFKAERELIRQDKLSRIQTWMPSPYSSPPMSGIKYSGSAGQHLVRKKTPLGGYGVVWQPSSWTLLPGETVVRSN